MTEDATRRGGRVRLVGAVLMYAVICSSAVARPVGPSFDCAKATAPVEKLTCADKTLGDLDMQLYFVLATKMRDAGKEGEAELRDGQQQWLTKRLDACGVSSRDELPPDQSGPATQCLIKKTRQRIEDLGFVVTPLDSEWVESPLSASPPVPPIRYGEEKSLPRTFAREADKAIIFQRYAQNATQQSVPVPTTKAEFELCRRFGEDLRAMRNIKFIEPIARGKTIDDPKLTRYWPDCDKLDPEYVEFPVNAPSKLYYRTKNSALYKINYLNEKPPILHYVLFSQGMCTIDNPQDCKRPDYELLNPEECELTGVYFGDDSYESGIKYGSSAVVSYDNIIWSLRVEDIGHSKYIELFANFPSSAKHNEYCLFTVP